MSRLLLMLATVVLLPLDAGDDFKSGLPEKSLLPGPVMALNINGKAKDRPASPTIGVGLNPAVAIFVRDSPEPGDQVPPEFLKKLDEACTKYQDYFLHGYVVFISPAAKSSRTENKVEDPKLIIKEAVARNKLTARLTELAMPLNHVIVAMMPEAPEKYQINDKPGVTVLVCAKHRVEMNFAFAEGKMTAEEGDRVLKGVAEFLKNRKKKNE